MIYPTERIGNPCPECGGTNVYCADCTDLLLENLNAIAKAGEAVMQGGELVPDDNASGLVKLIIPAQVWQDFDDALYVLRSHYNRKGRDE